MTAHNMSDYPRRAFVPIEIPAFAPLPEHPTTRDVAIAIREMAMALQTLGTVADNNFAAMFDRVKMIMLKLDITETEFRAKMDTIPGHNADDSAKLLVSDLELRLLRDSLQKRFTVWITLLAGALVIVPELIRLIFTGHW